MPATEFHRFSPTLGWLTHLWKSAARQDHARWRKVLRDWLPSNGVAPRRRSVAEPVAILTLDGLVSALQPERLDFTKAGIEGCEAARIAGARCSLRRYRPALLLEQDPHRLARAGVDPDRLWAELRSLGYHPNLMVDDTPVPAEQPGAGDVLWLPSHSQTS